MARVRCANAQSVAKSFFQLANRSYSTTIAQSSTPLEFLIPRCASGASRTRVAVATSPCYYSQTPRPGIRRALTSSVQTQTIRHFATSSARLQTRSILNTQKDEDGNEMMLEITPRAAKRLSQIMDKDKNPDLALRIQVESGGCHGFQYLMSLITLPEKGGDKWAEVVNEDDTIFQYLPEEADAASASEDGPKIILDEPSLDLLKGSKVDFTMELIGSQFKIVDNPYATSSCGCGTSFDIKG